jgi:hypothetical protein
MILKPRIGIDQLVFGLHQKQVVDLLGKPDKVFTSEDDEDETIYEYNQLRLRLNFYEHEQGKLGYITCSNPELTLDGKRIIGQPVKAVLKDVFSTYKDWDIENYDYFDTYVNETSWVVLNSEYEAVTDIEIGVPHNEGDGTYNWPKV